MSSPSPGLPVRVLRNDEWSTMVDVDANAFGTPVPSDMLESERELFDPGRDIGAFDPALDDAVVGIASAYALGLSVPGGSVPAAGITWVGVLPTHRRRGVLRSLMTFQLHQVHEAGREPVAALWASEPPIYGRFGYGPASAALRMEVARNPLALRRDAPVDPSLRVRLVPADDYAVTKPVYDAVAATRPGMLARDDRWWRRAVRDVPSMREGKSQLRCVVAEDATGVRGYTRYSTKPDWSPGRPEGSVDVRELVAVDAAARAALYRYLFDMDLMGSTHLWNVPSDDPLLLWLDNARGARVTLNDALYVRLVELPAALRARAYSSPVDVVIGVTDDVCPWNAGRWRLRADGAEVSCERTVDPPDLSTSVTELGAAYLGGTTLTSLADAGRVREQTPGALAAASAAFRWSPAPWCPVVF